MKRILQSVYFILFLISIGIGQLFAQSDSDTVDIRPHEVEFESTFQRLEGIRIINSSPTDTLLLDTVYYNSNLYSIRFDSYNNYPIHVSPGDTLMMDCILSGYFQVAAADTTDTLMISFNNHKTKRFVKIKIDFHEDDLREGKISGLVTANGNPLDSVSINFYYNGIYLFKSTKTNYQGKYSLMLPPGYYSISADKKGFNLTFFNNKPDPLSANFVTVARDSMSTADFNLVPDSSTGISVSGKILDALSKAAIGSGIVVIRKGIHTPGKISGTNSSDTYAAMVNRDGTYKINNLNAGTYYIQSFANYYTPAFYSMFNPGTTDWTKGDSVSVNGIKPNLDIIMPRDSSFGGGTISGKIKSNITNFAFSDIIVYAQSAYSNSEANYSFVDSAGNYSVKDLQYGTYRVLAQKIGFENIVSSRLAAITTTQSTDTLNLSYDTTSLVKNVTYPGTYVLYQNYPNPFNPTTNIRLHLGKSSYVTVAVTNILGQQVEVLEKGFLEAGNYNFIFNAKSLSSGTYFVSLITEEGIQVKKMQLIK